MKPYKRPEASGPVKKPHRRKASHPSWKVSVERSKATSGITRCTSESPDREPPPPAAAASPAHVPARGPPDGRGNNGKDLPTPHSAAAPVTRSAQPPTRIGHTGAAPLRSRPYRSPSSAAARPHRSSRGPKHRGRARQVSASAIRLHLPRASRPGRRCSSQARGRRCPPRYELRNRPWTGPIHPAWAPCEAALWDSRVIPTVAGRQWCGNDQGRPASGRRMHRDRTSGPRLRNSDHAGVFRPFNGAHGSSPCQSLTTRSMWSGSASSLSASLQVLMKLGSSLFGGFSTSRTRTATGTPVLTPVTRACC